MLWALGFVDDLARPDKICDVPNAVALLRDLGRDGFLKKAKLRPMREILDAADLIYREHWATTEARIKNQPAPGGLDPGVVQERHYALNWLIGYSDQEWDNVTIDALPAAAEPSRSGGARRSDRPNKAILDQPASVSSNRSARDRSRAEPDQVAQTPVAGLNGRAAPGAYRVLASEISSQAQPADAAGRARGLAQTWASMVRR
jgi:Domain of unknown function (DUF4272)